MPIRFVSTRSAYGNAAVNLAGVTGALAGDIAAPVFFTGSISDRLEDLSSQMNGQFLTDSARYGTVSATVGGISADLNGAFTPAGTPYWVGAPTSL